MERVSLASLGDYLRRGYEYLSGIIGRRTREEEEEEPEERLPVEEKELKKPEEFEEPVGALGAGMMTPKAKLPQYAQSMVPTSKGTFVRYSSQVEDIVSVLDYVTVIEFNLLVYYRDLATPVEFHEMHETEGIFFGDPIALANQYLADSDMLVGANYITGTAWTLVYDKTAEGTKGEIIMQKKTIYDRYFRT